MVFGIKEEMTSEMEDEIEGDIKTELDENKSIKTEIDYDGVPSHYFGSLQNNTIGPFMDERNIKEIQKNVKTEVDYDDVFGNIKMENFCEVSIDTIDLRKEKEKERARQRRKDKKMQKLQSMSPAELAAMKEKKREKDCKVDWKCDVCNISFMTRVKLRDHRREVKCKQRHLCTNKQRSFDMDVAMSKKVVQEKKIILLDDTKSELIGLNKDPKGSSDVKIPTQNECDEEISTKIDQNILQFNGSITNYTKSGEIYSCTHCNMTQTKERELQKHIQRVHLKDFYTVICKLCEKPFFKDDIKTHVKIVHAKEVRYMCHLCDFGCYKKQVLNRHISAKHENLKFPCKHCSFQSSDKGNLNRHETTVHSEERNFSCNICFKQFKEKRKLKSHFQNSHGTQKYLCGTCGKEFPSKEYLKTHEKHHDTNLLLYCSFCGKGFTTAVKLKEHINIHTGEKPFSCPMSSCDKSYPSSSALAHHKKTCF